MISPEVLLIVVRYLISSLCFWLAAHGYIHEMTPDDVIGAWAQITIGVAGWGGMLAWGLWRSRVPVLLARLRAHHKPALLASAAIVSPAKASELLQAAAQVSGVQKIVADPAVAAVVPSPKVVPPEQE